MQLIFFWAHLSCWVLRGKEICLILFLLSSHMHMYAGHAKEVGEVQASKHNHLTTNQSLCQQGATIFMVTLVSIKAVVYWMIMLLQISAHSQCGIKGRRFTVVETILRCHKKLITPMLPETGNETRNENSTRNKVWRFRI